MNPSPLLIADLMAHSGVGFGTSGARGLVSAMTDRTCYAYTCAFLQHLRQLGELPAAGEVALAGDLRPSSPRILAALASACHDLGHPVTYLGPLPTPALALWSAHRGIPGLMVTGSHIPDDRNGIKFYRPGGEILKADEEAIRAAQVVLPNGRFDSAGALLAPHRLPPPEQAAAIHYQRRYLDFFPAATLAGLRIGLYEHSSVARDLLYTVLTGLGAEVVRLGRSEQFVPVDTEAIRPEDIELAQRWAAQQPLDCLISADGDGDRPLLADEQGRWLRGDVIGILCAQYLGAGSVVTPVSSNSAVERCGLFRQVVRTRIGSPYVIEAMAALSDPAGVVGYEANGGFLTATPFHHAGRPLSPLPTRDALLVPLAVLALAAARQCPLSALLETLPARFTASDRLKAFPSEQARAGLDQLGAGRGGDMARIEALFGELSGAVAGVDETDGLRITFRNGEVIHLRPSGNAPELRCYTEAASAARATALNGACLERLQRWRT